MCLCFSNLEYISFLFPPCNHFYWLELETSLLCLCLEIFLGAIFFVSLENTDSQAEVVTNLGGGPCMRIGMLSKVILSCQSLGAEMDLLRVVWKVKGEDFSKTF